LKMRVSQGAVAGSRSIEDSFRTWVDLVEHYTRCSLTRDEDRLPAIGGLARMFSSGGKLGRYVVGMWERALLPSLLWRVEHTSIARKTRTYVAPSWSWASLVGQVDWKCAKEYRLLPMAHVLDCRTVRQGVDVFGRVEDGMLRIRTKTWEAQVEYQPAGGFRALTSGETAYFDVNGECRKNTHRSYSGVKFVVIAKGSSTSGVGSSVLFALVVEKTPCTEGGPPRYKRIGLAIIDARRPGAAVEETVILV